MIRYSPNTIRYWVINRRECFLVILFILSIFSVDSIYSQGRREIDKYKGYTYTPSDTSKFGFVDTTQYLLDTTRLPPVDSTARIKYFTYVPEYSYGIKIKEKSYPLLLGNSSYIVKKITFDSLNNVIVRETFQGEDIKAPLVLPLNKYLEENAQEGVRHNFIAIAQERFKGNVTDDLTRLFEKFTDISIPLPFKSETIFGPPTFNLRINGAVDITASYQNVKSDQQIASLLTNSQNNINFKQEIQVTAKGTVGDKLSVDADWNTQRVFDFENQLKIKYSGYADEVIQKIEAGNVSLDTKSTLIQSTQALFGVRGEFKLGPLNLTAVVSQKKSKQETQTYTGTAQQQEFQINVWNYSDNHYFLDTLYKSSFLEVFNSTTNTYSQQVYNNRVLSTNNDFEVWVQCDYFESQKRLAVAYVQLYERPPNGYPRDSIKTSLIPGVRFFGFFRKLSPNEYTINEYAGFISFKFDVQNLNIAVAYTTQDGKKYGKGSTESTGSDTLILKLIKCDNPDPENTPVAWELKMKNIYRLPVSKVIQDGFKLDVMYNDGNVFVPNAPIPGVNSTLSQITYLDRYQGTSLQGPPDNQFDFLPGRTINVETGDIIFPVLRPFWDNIVAVGGDSTFIFKEIYTQSKNLAQNASNANKYAIKGSAKGEAGISNTINLGFNVVQGSVKIYLDQTPLVENVDYSVDYSTGVVVIRNASALTSNKLRITYETNDLFTLASKTVIGLRGDYKINDKTNLGFTFVNLRQETLNDKVRIGEEPTNNSMFGLDLQTEFKPKFLTNLVNKLPGYNTKEESSISVKGEFAYLVPDPNTMKSRIPQDNNEAVAYIDDMEGAKKIISLGTNFSNWTISSVPVDSSIGSNDAIKQAKRGRLKWFNVPNDVDVRSVYPARDVQPGQDRLTPMYLVFDPRERGTYNYNVVHFDTTNKFTNWNGVMRYLNSTSIDMLNENINYIEFNMKVVADSGISLNNGKIIIDLGSISEDAIPNGILDTEDKNRNGILEVDEDIGLDGLINVQELDTLNARNGTHFTLNDFPDPALDDNSPNQIIDYNVINGTENNRQFEGGNRPDTEDLNRNGTLDTYNAYFEYEVSLDTANNKRISGRGAPNSGWYQYRIPLSEFAKKINNATLTRIEYARVWFKGVNGRIQVALIDFNLVGNQWIKPDKNDTTYNISVVSIEENSQIYQSPVPGDVLRQTIRNTTGVNTKSNEQSLSLEVKNLTNGQVKIAVKDYINQTIDLFNYKTLKLFVNGDPSFNYVNEKIYDATMIIRFGADSNNYYEYRAPIHPDVRPGQPWNPLNEVTINFADLTALKISRDSVNQVVDAKVPNGPPGAYYRIKGNPALNAVRQIVLGVEKNRSGLNASISGSVWFNEIRVLKVNDDNGYAFNMNGRVKFADLGDFTMNISKVDPNFHSLDTRVGSRNTGINWDFGITLNLHKVINNALANWISDDWKDFLSLPISFRHGESIINPKYYPGSDIDMDKAANEKYKQVLTLTGDVNLAQQASENIRKEVQTLSTRNEFSIQGLAFKFPWKNYFVQTILNGFSINFNGMFSNSRDFTYQNKFEFAYTGSLNFNTEFGLADRFNLNIGKYINLGDEYKNAKLYFFFPFIGATPFFSNTFSATTDFNRTRTESKQRRLLYEDPIARQFRANRGFSFNWKFIENWIVDLTGNYSVRIGSDLSVLETYNDSSRSQRPESEILKDIFFNEGIINYGRDLDYTQTTTFNPKINLPFLNKYLDLTGSYNVTYGWSNPNATANIGYNVGYANTITTNINLKVGEILNLFKKSNAPDVNGPKKFGQGVKKYSVKLQDDDNKTNFSDILNLLATFIPDVVNVTYNQTNNVTNPGVEGRPGFGNFWWSIGTKEELGPSRSYQLGFSMYPGKRVGNLTLTDVFNQNNNLNLTASIAPIIPSSIRMNLSFKRGWGFNNATSYISNSDGTLTNPTNKSSAKTFSYSMFFAGKVEKLSYEVLEDPVANATTFADKFKKEIGAIPFPNWTMTISGLEKFPLFAEFASTVTLENSFTAEYSEATALDPRNIELPSRQSVTQSFNPLIGLNITFKPLGGGNLSAQFRINKSVTNTLVPTSNLIQVTNTNDWSLNASYQKSGFEIPLFGLSLQNDIAFSLTVSKNSNDPLDYRYEPGIPQPRPLPGNGQSIFTFNPSIQYSLSSRVQMQVFYKYIRTEPTQQTYNTVPRTSNEGGLNIRISIQ